ncbi:hypothetical protein HGRIS_006578 [Hohenbuehelia grisea]|uniref:Uncharacterized protein n=1 Tax=Hohenbuehelia grisea TaxID=104357 RepID=A0ABR3J9E5_9AGAR
MRIIVKYFANTHRVTLFMIKPIDSPYNGSCVPIHAYGYLPHINTNSFSWSYCGTLTPEEINEVFGRPVDPTPIASVPDREFKDVAEFLVELFPYSIVPESILSEFEIQRDREFAAILASAFRQPCRAEAPKLLYKALKTYETKCDQGSHCQIIRMTLARNELHGTSFDRGALVGLLTRVYLIIARDAALKELSFVDADTSSSKPGMVRTVSVIVKDFLTSLLPESALEEAILAEVQDYVLNFSHFDQVSRNISYVNKEFLYQVWCRALFNAGSFSLSSTSCSSLITKIILTSLLTSDIVIISAFKLGTKRSSFFKSCLKRSQLRLLTQNTASGNDHGIQLDERLQGATRGSTSDQGVSGSSSVLA